MQIRPRVNKARTGVETQGVKQSMNPFDELSIEAAVRLREAKKTPVEDILAFTAGPAKCADVLRTAMAMGADRSIVMTLEAVFTVLATIVDDTTFASRKDVNRLAMLLGFRLRHRRLCHPVR